MATAGSFRSIEMAHGICIRSAVDLCIHCCGCRYRAASLKTNGTRWEVKMMNRSGLHGRGHTASAMFPPTETDCTGGERIVAQIAAPIGCGDRVVCMGTGAAAMAEAVRKAGGQAVSPGTDEGAADRIFRQKNIVDQLFWGMDSPWSRAVRDGELCWARRWLRPGGRMLLWSLVGACRDSGPLVEQLRRLAVGAGLVSVIAGTRPFEEGTVVVATGILQGRPVQQ
jgi:hypothetical protein